MALKTVQDEEAFANSKEAEINNALPVLINELEAAEEINEPFLSEFSTKLSKLLECNIYVTEKLENVDPDTEDVNATIRYIAASEGQEFLLDKKINDPNSITLGTWVFPPVPEVEDEDEDEDYDEYDEEEEGEEEEKEPPPPPELPIIHIKNVLRDLPRSSRDEPPKTLAFHGIPAPGAYITFPFQYNSPLNTDCLVPPPEEYINFQDPIVSDIDVTEGNGEEQQATEEREEKSAEEGAEGESEENAENEGESSPMVGVRKLHPMIGEPPEEMPLRNLALCADTIGQGRDFASYEIEFLKEIRNHLKESMARTERVVYKTEYLNVHLPRNPQEEATLISNEHEASEAILRAAEEAAAPELEPKDEDDEVPDDIRSIAVGRNVMAAVITQLEERLEALEEILVRRIQPPDFVVKLFQAVFLALGRKPDELAEPDVQEPMETPSWRKIKALVRPIDKFLEALKSVDPSQPSRILPFSNNDTLNSIIEEFSIDDLVKGTLNGGASCLALPPLQTWVRTFIQVREAGAAKREREAEEARIAAEEAEQNDEYD